MKKTNENYRIKQNKAITLIALIITIIVLLILAGISINFLMGENRNNAACTKKWRAI